MIGGGIVFRVVTPNYPGYPKLDRAGAPAIRTEYLASDRAPWTWTQERISAFIFPSHLEAVIAAKKIRHCHASIQAVRIPKMDPFRVAQCRRDPMEVL